MAHKLTLWTTVFAAVPYALLALGGQAHPKKPAPNASSVLPVFRAHCITCHSGDGAAGNLDLSSVAGLKKGGVSGKLFVPGKSETSLLIRRLRGLDGKPRMPMGFAPLSDGETDLIATWIDTGGSLDAKDTRHWAYVAPVKPAVPKVKDEAWVRNPIDAFVLAKLEKQGLHPSRETDKETLIRRVTLDLTGLPPTLQEIDAFLKDRRPDAYERLVDRLLASPRYGERQARPWLDLARYADSDGYEKDLNRTAWKYRDWVIDAFNRNLPYDQFTIDQIAGDMLPHPTTSDLIATGFNRNTMFNREGGVDQAEAHFNVVIDRVNTTATVWLGSTLQCARCHDHKYDPFTQKDYYRMAAFFNNSVVYPRGPKSIGEEKWFESEIQAPTAEQVARRRYLKTISTELERKMQLDTPGLRADFTDWRQSAGRAVQWTTMVPSAAASEGAAKLQVLKDGSVLASGPNPARDTYTISGSMPLKDVTGLRIEALTDPSLAGKGPGRAPNGNFVLTGVELRVNGSPVPLKVVGTDYVQPEFDATGVLSNDLASGWAVDLAEGVPHELVVEPAEPLSSTGAAAVQVVLLQQSRYDLHNLGHFRVSLTSAKRPSASVLPSGVRKALSSSQPEDQQAVEAYYRSVSPLLSSLRQRKVQANADLQKLDAEIPTALVMRDKPTKGPLKAHVHIRGEFLSLGDEVTAAVPGILPPLPPDERPSRLALAKWLVSRDNPLTARVEVNRLWEQAFGQGIVETSEDFGTQGAKPTHPKLLDWLACRFMDSGWNMKALNRLIVTSATYRQTSDATKALIERDPRNELLARGPRFRMAAEMIHDVVLASSGLLTEKLGGPSVMPYQPEGVWDTPFNGESWNESKGADQYRRGLYTFWKRSAPYPSFLTFDATSREECTVRRIRTNTPLQALAQLNDRIVMDAARALASRMVAKGGDAGLTLGFRLCTARSPKKPEMQRLEALLKKLESRYAGRPDDAKKLAGDPKTAAWTMVANVLLNLDETITKG